jgi:signal transduction histidine kinase
MDRIKKWFHRIPIPAAFVICGMTALLCALSLTKATMWFAQKNKGEIAAGYAELISLEQEAPQDFVQAELELIPAQENQSELELNAIVHAVSSDAEIVFLEEDRIKYNFYEELDKIAAILWYSVCLCLASLVFYFWKIKNPLRILNQAAHKISDNDLNFHIDYAGQDELGRLCQAFESMRQELVQTNKRMWNSVEERKRLNAAFAHDLRTPLTVLQGHADMLLDTLDDKQDANQEILSSVQAISKQITRMNSYMDTMSALRRLEDYEPCLKAVSSKSLAELLEETASSLFPTQKTAIHFEIQEQELWMDREAFSQIYENLLSNAARYARESILVRLYREEDFVILEVADDGAGFTRKDLQNAFAPYYRGERSKPASSSHFGLGLYICSLLAEKLGGGMQLANVENGGAKVTVKLITFQKI